MAKKSSKRKFSNDEGSGSGSGSSHQRSSTQRSSNERPSLEPPEAFIDPRHLSLGPRPASLQANPRNDSALSTIRRSVPQWWMTILRPAMYQRTFPNMQSAYDELIAAFSDAHITLRVKKSDATKKELLCQRGQNPSRRKLAEHGFLTGCPFKVGVQRLEDGRFVWIDMSPSHNHNPDEGHVSRWQTDKIQVIDVNRADDLPGSPLASGSREPPSAVDPPASQKSPTKRSEVIEIPDDDDDQEEEDDETPQLGKRRVISRASAKIKATADDDESDQDSSINQYTSSEDEDDQDVDRERISKERQAKRTDRKQGSAKENSNPREGELQERGYQGNLVDEAKYDSNEGGPPEFEVADPPPQQPGELEFDEFFIHSTPDSGRQTLREQAPISSKPGSKRGTSNAGLPEGSGKDAKRLKSLIDSSPAPVASQTQSAPGIEGASISPQTSWTPSVASQTQSSTGIQGASISPQTSWTPSPDAAEAPANGTYARLLGVKLEDLYEALNQVKRVSHKTICSRLELLLEICGQDLPSKSRPMTSTPRSASESPSLQAAISGLGAMSTMSLLSELRRRGSDLKALEERFLLIQRILQGFPQRASTKPETHDPDVFLKDPSVAKTKTGVEELCMLIAEPEHVLFAEVTQTSFKDSASAKVENVQCVIEVIQHWMAANSSEIEGTPQSNEAAFLNVIEKTPPNLVSNAVTKLPADVRTDVLAACVHFLAVIAYHRKRSN